MAFGITRQELEEWKQAVSEGQIAYLTHFWHDPRFPSITSVTKVGCSDVERLRRWAVSHGLRPQYIHFREPFPHYDLFGEVQIRVLKREGLWDHLERFVWKDRPNL